MSAGVSRKCCSTAWPRPATASRRACTTRLRGNWSRRRSNRRRQARPAACSDRKSAPRRRACPPEHHVLHGVTRTRRRRTRTPDPRAPELRATEVAERNGDGRDDELPLFCAAVFVRCHSGWVVSDPGVRAGRMPGPLSSATRPCGRSRQSMARAGSQIGRGFRFGRLGLEFQRPPAFGANRRERVVKRRAKPIPSHRLDEELHPLRCLCW